MNWLLLAVLLIVTIVLIAAGLSRPGKVYEYPFLAGTTFLGFVVPQLPAYADDRFLPPGAFAKTVLFTTLCAAAVGAGWAAANRPMRAFSWRFDEGRLLRSAALLVLAGAFFYFKISRLPKSALDPSGWTGIATVYFFFSRLMFFGWVAAVVCFTRRPRSFALAIVVFGAALILDRIVFGGRRQETVEALLTISIALWFQRRIAVPRGVALVAALLAGLALSSTGNYRAISTGEDSKWSGVEKIDVIGNFIDLLQNGGAEMLNCIERVNFVDRTQNFDFGAFHWNILVFNFVPAQFLGRDFKESLMIPLVADRDYNPPVGATETGMSDAFASFWYFGAVEFFLIALVLGRIYRAAMSGSTAAQILYALSAATSMMEITHSTQWLFSDWVEAGVFLLPMLAFARVRGTRNLPPRLLRPRLAAVRFPRTGGEMAR
jgi:hypothetical protein